MKLGCATMSSHGLWPGHINWVHGNATDQRFFDWIKSEFQFNRHQIVTLLQPCLRETALLELLRSNAHFSKTNELSSRIIMPILLKDTDSIYYRSCDNFVRIAMETAKKERKAPLLMWNQCEFGSELLRLSFKADSYINQQYFVCPEKIVALKMSGGYKDVFDELFGGNQSRMIESRASTRMLCVWDVDK